MKALMGLLTGMGVFGVAIFFTIWATLLLATVYGLWLAFSASIILGIIVLLVEPSPAIIGLVMLFFGKNLAQMLIDFLSK